jgi:hypothetical protein
VLFKHNAPKKRCRLKYLKEEMKARIAAQTIFLPVDQFWGFSGSFGPSQSTTLTWELLLWHNSTSFEVSVSGILVVLMLNRTGTFKSLEKI